MERKPEWLRIKASVNSDALETEKIIKQFNLHTVCESARCPNKGECFSNRTATFMVLGDICTRSCSFCAVSKNVEKIKLPDPEEPRLIAEATQKMGLDYVVLTMVTRDDLLDGGAEHVAATVRQLRSTIGDTLEIEVLVSDFQGEKSPLLSVLSSNPSVFNHNVETVPRLYSQVRPQANYERSLSVLNNVKRENSSLITKSGLMVGLGETEEEVSRLMDDLLTVGVDVLTIGQYLAPTSKHHPVFNFVHPDIFERLRQKALEKGFKACFSGPFVRSSYRAKEILAVKRITLKQ